jgi:hypothetical protein
MNISKEIKIITKDFPNKRTELRAVLYQNLAERVDKLFTSLDNIQGREFVDKYLSILSFVLPKMSEETLNFDGEAPTLQFNVVDRLTPKFIAPMDPTSEFDELNNIEV